MPSDGVAQFNASSTLFTTPGSNRHVHSCNNLFHAWFVMQTDTASTVNISCTATTSHLFNTQPMPTSHHERGIKPMMMGMPLQTNGCIP